MADGRPKFPVELRRRFWDGVRRGLLVQEAAAAVGVSRSAAQDWFVEVGGVNPYDAQGVTGRYLSMAEREEIAVGRAAGQTQAEIAAGLGRSPSTISRELARNSPVQGQHRSKANQAYRAGLAQSKADQRAKRPKELKIPANTRLHGQVQDGFDKRWSPEQISHRLLLDFPDDESMRVSHETIYTTLYVQPVRELTRELDAVLRTGRSLRKPRRSSTERRGRIPDMVPISHRPAEAEDRAVPGHWEGDLIIGPGGRSAIGTLVERTSRSVLLLHLPDTHGAQQVREAAAAKIADLPGLLVKTLTWDQGVEMAQHARFTIDTGVQVYFCDPHSPWQRGSNENTNGLLRQYFPKGTDLSQFSADYLDAVAQEMNGRPRKTLGWCTPAEVLNTLLSNPDAETGVIATTS